MCYAPSMETINEKPRERENGQTYRGAMGLFEDITKGSDKAQKTIKELVKTGKVEAIIAHSNGNHHALKALTELQSAENFKYQNNVSAITYYGIAPGSSWKYVPNVSKNSKLFYHSDDMVINGFGRIYGNTLGSDPVATLQKKWKDKYKSGSVKSESYDQSFLLYEMGAHNLYTYKKMFYNAMK